MKRDPTAFIRDHYNSVASRYDRLIKVPERLLFADGRRWAAGQARGNVLEIAVGTGRNLPHYPSGTQVTGVDPSSAMIDIARSRATGTGIPVELQVADAQDLPYTDESFDTSSRRWRCAASRGTPPQWRRSRGFCVPGGR